MSTFFQLPSAQIVSLAAVTFSGVLNKYFVGRQTNEKFSSHQHPLPEFADLEKRVIAESAVFSREEGFPPVAVFFLVEPDPCSFLNILRVNIRNLSTTVGHHFDYKVDGHMRVYRQHCISTSNDDFKVTYLRNI